MLRVETAATVEAIDAWVPQWAALLERCGRNEPFLTPDWIQLCLRHFGAASEPRLFAVLRGNRLVGVAPLALTHTRRRGLSVRRLGFIDAPDSPMSDLVAEPAERQAVAAAVVGRLYSDRESRWDVAELSRWPAGSPHLALVERALDGEGRASVRSLSAKLAVLEIDGDWDAFWVGCSSKYRKTTRNIVNRVEQRLEDVRVDLYRDDPRGELIGDIVELSARSWKRDEGIALSNDRATREFFADLTELAARRGWLMAWILRSAGRPIAMEYGLAWEGRLLSLRADYDVAYRESSPGAYLQHAIQRQLFELGFREYNAGPGLGEYKLRTAVKIHENVTLSVFGETLRGKALQALESSILPAARGLRDDLASA